jgi:hypothetical protein
MSVDHLQSPSFVLPQTGHGVRLLDWLNVIFRRLKQLAGGLDQICLHRRSRSLLSLSVAAIG